MSTLLEVENLTVDIPLATGMLHAVRGIGFSVEKSSTLCIVGESGCGKSLTALALMGLLPGQARRTVDRLSFDGIDLAGIREARMRRLRGQRIAMIFQEPMTSLNPSYTIGNQIEEALLCHQKLSAGAARDRAVFLLEKVGIIGAASRLGQYPHQLSGGLRQRVMIAMALMCEPDLIIADEPTTALDVTIQAQILHLLTELQREFHMAMILITHDLGIVARVADNVAVMYAGEFVETGSCAEVFRHPLHPYTQGLLGCIPVPGKTAPFTRLGTIPGVVPSLVGEATGCGFYGRCAYAEDACLSTVPLTGHDGGGHCYRCVLPSARLEALAEEAVAS